MNWRSSLEISYRAIEALGCWSEGSSDKGGPDEREGVGVARCGEFFLQPEMTTLNEAATLRSGCASARALLAGGGSLLRTHAGDGRDCESYARQCKTGKE